MWWRPPQLGKLKVFSNFEENNFEGVTIQKKILFHRYDILWYFRHFKNSYLKSNSERKFLSINRSWCQQWFWCHLHLWQWHVQVLCLKKNGTSQKTNPVVTNVCFWINISVLLALARIWINAEFAISIVCFIKPLGKDIICSSITEFEQPVTLWVVRKLTLDKYLLSF